MTARWPASRPSGRRGEANGVEGLEIVDAAGIRRREPHAAGVAALVSPNTGVVEPEALVHALERAPQGGRRVPAARHEPRGADLAPGGLLLHTERESILARVVVNAGGLFADHVSAMLGGESFGIYPCRGEYAELAPSRAHLVNALVYPLPNASGPRTRGAPHEDHPGHRAHRADRPPSGQPPRLRILQKPFGSFLEPARRLLPELGPGDLRLGGSGIRPNLNTADERFADFLIRRDRVNPRVVHAAGINSPGLTACLAVGRLVTTLVYEALLQPQGSGQAHPATSAS